jgi:hypothetical protein
MFKDLILLLQQGLGLAREEHVGSLVAFTMGGGVAAVLCFFICSWFTRLWNRKFQATLSHYLWCGVAALVTILLSVGLAAVMNLGAVAKLRLDQWRAPFEDKGSAQSIRLWEAERKGLEAADYPQPDRSENLHKYRDKEAYAVAAKASSAEALLIFKENNPFLYGLIVGTTDRAVKAVQQEMETFFQEHPGEIYDFKASIKLLQADLGDEFNRRIPGFQQAAIWVAVAIFLVVQAVPILLAGLAAYQQIGVSSKRGAPRRAGATLSSRKSPSGRTSRYRR